MKVSPPGSASAAFGRPMRLDLPAARTMAGIMVSDRIESRAMSEIDLHIRCQRCGTDMELRDPVSVENWKPDQFWVCPKCGRHFWSTYPPPNRDKAKPTAGTA